MSEPAWPAADEPAERVVAALELQPLPGEGGFWRPGPRTPRLSSILFLLTDAPDGFSAMHRLDVTEGWQWLAGAPASLVVSRGRRLVGARLAPGGRLQEVVPVGSWQAARTEGAWTLVSCWCAPAFTDGCFTLGRREELAAAFATDAEVVRLHTRIV